MLSNRLESIAKLIDKNSIVYDVGTDHALLPCFLVLNNICKKVYACDNKKGPLKKAEANIEKYCLKGKVIPVLASGIESICSDVDVLVIAGMGFYSVKEILENKDLRQFKKIIVQVNKGTNKLRKWINDNQYSIIDELVIKDDFFYEIEVFNSLSKFKELTDTEIEYGPLNLLRKNDVFIEYLMSIRDKLMSISTKNNNNIYQKEIDRLNGIIYNGF